MPRRNPSQLRTVLDKDLHEAERQAANAMAAAEGVTLSNFTRRLLRKEYRKRVCQFNQKLFADLVPGTVSAKRKKQPKPAKKGEKTDGQQPM